MLKLQKQLFPKITMGFTEFFDAAKTAIERDDLTTLKELVETHGFDVTEHGLRLLFYAGKFTTTDVVDYLIGQGVDVNGKDEAGDTIVHDIATEYYRHSLLSYLIQKGANVNEKGRYGDTPLHRLCENIDPDDVNLCRDDDVLSILLNNGADRTAKNNEGLTPLDVFVHNNPNQASVGNVCTFLESVFL